MFYFALTDNQAEVIFWTFFFLVIAVYLHFTKTKTQELVAKNYDAVIGNNLESPFGKFSGIKVNLHKNVPHIVMDSRYNQFLGSDISFSIDKSQKVQLEGNFSDLFDVYIVKNQEALALSILTPDMLWVMSKYSRKYNIMFYRDNLYVFFKRKRPLALTQSKKITLAAAKILEQLDEKLKNWPKENEKHSNKYLKIVTEEEIAKKREKGLYLLRISSPLFIIFAPLITVIALKVKSDSDVINSIYMTTAILLFLLLIYYGLFRKK